MGASQRQSLPMVGAAKCLVGILKHHLAYFVISSKVKQQRIVVLGYDPTMASIEELHDRKIDEILHYGPHLPMKKLGCIVVCFIFTRPSFLLNTVEILYQPSTEELHGQSA